MGPRKRADPPPLLVDNLCIPDAEMENLPVDLLEYLERQDNPDPDYHPVPKLAVTVPGYGSGLPPSDADCALPTGSHVHGQRCAYRWKAPSVRPVYRQPGRRKKLADAGILDFLSFNFPTANRTFMDTVWKDIKWSDGIQAVVITPTADADPTGQHQNPPAVKAVTLTMAFLQRLWPSLPSTASRAKALAVAPSDTNEDFVKDSVLRYFAVNAFKKHEHGCRFINLDHCFNTALYRYLLRLSYIFGWQGFPTLFPTKYLPMALMTFLAGAVFPWADLLMQELRYDVKMRRRCPSMVRVWKAIWDFALVDGASTATAKECRFNYVPLLHHCRDTEVPFEPEDMHFHVEDIFRWTPKCFRGVLERGACPFEDCPQLAVSRRPWNNFFWRIR